MDDARVLRDRARYGGSIYLAGYAIECHLKFSICHRHEIVYLPAEFEVHDWDVLVAAAGLGTDIRAQRGMNALYSSLAETWGPALRYRTKAYTAGDGLRLYSEMETLYQFFSELAP